MMKAEPIGRSNFEVPKAYINTPAYAKDLKDLKNINALKLVAKTGVDKFDIKTHEMRPLGANNLIMCVPEFFDPTYSAHVRLSDNDKIAAKYEAMSSFNEQFFRDIAHSEELGDEQKIIATTLGPSLTIEFLSRFHVLLDYERIAKLIENKDFKKLDELNNSTLAIARYLTAGAMCDWYLITDKEIKKATYSKLNELNKIPPNKFAKTENAVAMANIECSELSRSIGLWAADIADAWYAQQEQQGTPKKKPEADAVGAPRDPNFQDYKKIIMPSILKEVTKVSDGIITSSLKDKDFTLLR